jgi:hypothetical protein
VPRQDEINQIHHDIRSAVAEVWRRVTEWRDTTEITDERDQRRYEQTAEAVTAVNRSQPVDTRALALAVQPILTAWRPNRAGPEQAIYAAVDRLRALVQHVPDTTS